MRIIGGKHKGRALSSPAGQSTRPTSDRVRESLFNILAHGIADFTLEGARVLDLFAGTGALGLEALSRGAKYCHFVDDSAAARGLIRANADSLGLIGHCKIWRRDATGLGTCSPLPAFDLVFADPPYAKGLGEKALASVTQGGWLNAGAVVVLEEAAKVIVAAPAPLALLDQRVYGETQVLLFRIEA